MLMTRFMDRPTASHGSIASRTEWRNTMSDPDRWKSFSEEELLEYISDRLPEIKHYIKNADWRGGLQKSESVASAADELLARFKNYDGAK